MTQPADLIIDNGTIVTEELTFAASLAIRDGRIAAIGAADEMPPAAERLDAAGLHVLPGVIDVHVHFREPGMVKPGGEKLRMNPPIRGRRHAASRAHPTPR